jgi:hypothetical protein
MMRWLQLMRNYFGAFASSQVGVFQMSIQVFSKKSANQKQELPMVAMFVNGSGQNEQSLKRTFYRCFLQSFSSFG